MESFVKVWYLCAYKGLTYSLNLVCNVSQFKFKLIKLTMFWNQSVQINHLTPFSNEHWVSKKEDVKEKKDWAVSTSLSQKKLRWSISWKLQTEFWISGDSARKLLLLVAPFLSGVHSSTPSTAGPSLWGPSRFLYRLYLGFNVILYPTPTSKFHINFSFSI